MTLFSKLGFCPPIDQPRAFAEAYALQTNRSLEPLENVLAREPLGNEIRQALTSELIHKESASE